MMVSHGSHIENVIVHYPITAREESASTQESTEESNSNLVINTVVSDGSWKRFDGDEFKLLHGISIHVQFCFFYLSTIINFFICLFCWICS